MEWIGVKDRMPVCKRDKEVLTFEFVIDIKTKKKIPVVCIEETDSIYIEKGKVKSDGGGQDITHWMPLPRFPDE